MEPNAIETTAVTRREEPTRGLAPRTVLELVERKNLVQEVMRRVMVDGEHYGHIPGTKDDKKALLKPGAEILSFTFRLTPEYDITMRELGGGHREYEVKCRLSDGTEGVGSCSTWESKYRYRSGSRKCPKCGQEAIIKGKAEYGGGWLCFTKRGGCGAKWKDGAPEIESQETGKIENPDPADQYNTVLKMAKKRAHVDAVLTATAASDIFTQDIADPEEEAEAPIPPAPARPEGTGTWFGNIKTVTAKHDKAGKWTLYTVHGEDEGASFTTFSRTEAEVAKALIGQGEVKIEHTTGKYGTELVSIGLVEETA